MSNIETEARDFVKSMRESSILESDMRDEYRALADAVDNDAEIPNDAEIIDKECRCMRCGASVPFPLPMSIAAVPHWLNYFKYQHQYCKAKL